MDYIASLLYIKKVSELPDDMMPFVEFKAALENRVIAGDEVVAIFRIVSTDSFHPVFLDEGIKADEVAEEAQFFSFGTNDLTQMTFGYSRDDAGKFLAEYQDIDILPDDPFQSLDQTGVGQLVEMGVQKGRTTKPDLKIGICGEHGGDPKSVHFCDKVGMNYVSCSPYRVPIARLAAAQAVLAAKKSA